MFHEPAATVSPGNFKKKKRKEKTASQVHLRLSESESAFEQDLQVICMHIKVWRSQF